MELLKLKILDTDGQTLMTAPGAAQVSLVYMNAYKPGDRVALEIGTPGQYVVIQFEDTMAPVLVYVVKREINFHIPFDEQAITYSPKSFAGTCHIIRARFATKEEIAARRNLAFNPYDEHGDTGFYPHASANVETRGEAVFAARNAIDGVYENDAHGTWPYQSWGINRDPNAALQCDHRRLAAVCQPRGCPLCLPLPALPARGSDRGHDLRLPCQCFGYGHHPHGRLAASGRGGPHQHPQHPGCQLAVAAGPAPP